jgi:hypothetical protein
VTSDIDICNMALDNINARVNIQSFNDNTKASDACKRWYAPTRDYTLQKLRWSFARKQLALALLKDATQGSTTVPVPWLYEYARPADCLQVRFLMPTLQVVPTASVAPGNAPAEVVYVGPAVKYVTSIDQDSAGNDVQVILTNQPQAIIVYTRQQTNPDLFDAQFTEAFAMVLGAKLCLPLTGNVKIRDSVAKDAEQMVLEAAASNQNEGLTQQQYLADWHRIRGYLADYATPDLLFLDAMEVNRML